MKVRILVVWALSARTLPKWCFGYFLLLHSHIYIYIYIYIYIIIAQTMSRDHSAVLDTSYLVEFSVHWSVQVFINLKSE